MTELKRILLVEDSPNDVELILASLTENRLGNEVVVVRDGEEALDYLYRRGIFRMRQEGDPILILLDLKLPKIDGLEVLAQVKTDPELRVLPIVVLTSSKEEPDLVRCYGLGVNAYVVKPIAFHDFMEAIKQIGLFWAVINQPPLLLPSSLSSVNLEKPQDR
jgi:CheY-like chemotaxis protein